MRERERECNGSCVIIAAIIHSHTDDLHTMDHTIVFASTAAAPSALSAGSRGGMDYRKMQREMEQQMNAALKLKSQRNKKGSKAVGLGA